MLGELLLQADLVAAGAREAVEEVEGQLEVADKQLRNTRAFLEEQAVEREGDISSKNYPRNPKKKFTEPMAQGLLNTFHTPLVLIILQ